MDSWVEDVRWRNSRWQQGKDDWEFYWEKYGEYFSPGVPVDWNSGPLKDLSAHKHSNSLFTIKTSLNEEEWQYMMEILARIDVSQIEHMEVELMGDLSSGIHHLSNVVGSGSFLGLKTLKIRIPSGEELGWMESRDLQKALEAGRFVNLVTLSLPACRVHCIVEGLMKGLIFKLRSFSIVGTMVDSESCLWLGSVLAGEAFNYVQHLQLSGGDEYCWGDVISDLESGKVPNLTSLSLSGNQGVRLTDLVPFLLSNPLENLIVDGGGVGSVEFQDIIDTIMSITWSPLALKRLDLHNNMLDDMAVSSLVHLANSDQLAQLQELDLRMNSGISSSSLATLTETIQQGHLPCLKLLVLDGTGDKDPDAAQAFVRLCNTTDGLADEWYHVLHRLTRVNPKGVLKQDVSQYNVERIQLTDMKDHKTVHWNRDMPHYVPTRCNCCNG
ncbi:unnamed protein product [Calypogeia fissa]